MFLLKKPLRSIDSIKTYAYRTKINLMRKKE